MNNFCCPLTLYHTIATLKDPQHANTVAKEEILIKLVIRIFTFSHSVFYYIIEKNPHLTLSQMTNLRFFQPQRVWRRHFQID